MHAISITVGAVSLTEWQSYQIESDLLQDTSAFSFTAHNVGGALAGRVSPHDLVRVYVDGALQLTGYVDAKHHRVDAQGGAVLEIVGRDAFGQLVDVDATPQTIRDKDLEQLSALIASPWVTEWVFENQEWRKKLQYAHGRLKRLLRFGPSRETARVAAAQRNLSKIRSVLYPRIKIEPGEKILEVIKRAAMGAGMHVWLNQAGIGVIARPDYAQRPVQRLCLYPREHQNHKLNNVESVEGTEDWTQRYRTYRQLGYTPNDDATSGEAARHDISETDEAVLEARQIVLPRNTAQNRAQARAELKRTRQQRAFDATELVYVVHGHAQNDALWQVDTIVTVDDAIGGYHGRYYVTRRRFIGDQSGQRTELSLRAPEVWLP